MHIVRHSVQSPPGHAKQVAIVVDRHALAKTRWRATAEDGVEFGFDLHQPLRHEDVVFVENGTVYAIHQKPEPVLEVRDLSCRSQAALIGWSIGNLHQSMELLPEGLRVQDDPALRKLFEQLGVEAKPLEAVFQPMKAGHSHGH